MEAGAPVPLQTQHILRQISLHTPLLIIKLNRIIIVLFHLLPVGLRDIWSVYGAILVDKRNNFSLVFALPVVKPVVVPVLMILENGHDFVDVPVVFGVGVQVGAIQKFVIGITLIPLEPRLRSARCHIHALSLQNVDRPGTCIKQHPHLLRRSPKPQLAHVLHVLNILEVFAGVDFLGILLLFSGVGGVIRNHGPLSDLAHQIYLNQIFKSSFFGFLGTFSRFLWV